jgi:hypothetical protein
MKTLYLLTILILTCSLQSSGQILCVQCFDQNEAISPEAVNRMSNGGFENTTCTPGWLEDSYCPNSALYNCDLSNWTCTGGDTQSYPSVFDSTLSTIPEGLNAAYLGNGNAFGCSDQWGDTTCQSREQCTIVGIPAGYPHSNPGYGEQTGVSIEQTVSGLTIGETYILEFWAGGEPLLGLLLSEAVFAVDIGFGKIYLLCKPTGPDSPVGTRYLIEFVAAATSHTIKFTNWGHTCIDCTELVLDDVRLYPIAELSAGVPECASGISDKAVKEATITYPNPFTSEIIMNTGLNASFRLTLYDITSNPVLSRDFVNTVTVNTTTLPTGIYFYEVTDDKAIRQTGKLLKE